MNNSINTENQNKLYYSKHAPYVDAILLNELENTPVIIATDEDICLLLGLCNPNLFNQHRTDSFRAKYPDAIRTPAQVAAHQSCIARFENEIRAIHHKACSRANKRGLLNWDKDVFAVITESNPTLCLASQEQTADIVTAKLSALDEMLLNDERDVFLRFKEKIYNQLTLEYLYGIEASKIIPDKIKNFIRINKITRGNHIITTNLPSDIDRCKKTINRNLIQHLTNTAERLFKKDKEERYEAEIERQIVRKTGRDFMHIDSRYPREILDSRQLITTEAVIMEYFSIRPVKRLDEYFEQEYLELM